MLYSNFKKEEPSLNNILFECTLLCKLMLLLFNLDMVICHIILVCNLTNTDTFHQYNICKLTNTYKLRNICFCSANYSRTFIY